MQLICGYLCKQGVDRNKNQDSMFFQQGYAEGRKVCVAAVCDGVGAFPDSDFASQLVTEFVKEWFEGFFDSQPVQRGGVKKSSKLLYEELKNSLREKLWSAHQRVTDEMAQLKHSSATTVCVILVVENLYCIYNSGDSRAYEIGGKMLQLTKDQTMERNGKTVLSNCLGCFPGPNFTRIEGKIRRNSSYILASDGFYRRMDATNVIKLLKKIKSSEELTNAMYSLYEHALANGEKDDSTGVALKFI